MDERTTILAVDDEPELLRLLDELLDQAGYRVLLARSGEEARSILLSQPVHLIVLDIAMPREDGFAVCRSIRSITTAPVLFLTARTRDEDKVAGFEAGGDDFLAKPFSRVELTSRIKALLRRCYEYQPPQQAAILRRGALEIDRREHTVTVEGREVPLTTTEFAFLLLMAQNPGRVFSAQELYEHTWMEGYTHANNNTVIVHISNLRRKLGDNPKRPVYIKNVWGRGYYVE